MCERDVCARETYVQERRMCERDICVRETYARRM